MKCPIKGVSKDCRECNGESTTWEVNGEVIECVYVIVWKARQKPQTSSPYKELKESEGLTSLKVEYETCIRCGSKFEKTSFLSKMCMDCALEMSE